MSRLQRKKMLKITLILAGLLAVTIGTALGIRYYQTSQRLSRQPESEESGQEKEEGMEVLEEDSDGPLTDDMRIQKYTCIRLTERMKKGDYVDIRISFANGADFILLSKKRIQDITLSGEDGSENALWMNVSEEEILRISSAEVDAYLNEGCSIYAIQYIQKEQKAAVMNYKVNDVVEQLIAENPNIVEKAENVLEWQLWKELKGEGNTLSLEADEPYKEEPGKDGKSGPYGEKADSQVKVPPEEIPEDEIIYFD